jgi:hypothetical protein
MPEIPLNYQPRTDQLSLLKNSAPRQVVVCGRRWGKTYGLAIPKCIIEGLRTPGIYWWIAPTFNLSERGRRAFRSIMPQGHFEEVKSERFFKFGAGTELWLKSCEDPDKSLVGEGLHGVVIEEASLIPDFEMLWNQYIEPALSDFDGWAMLIFTPRGHGYTHDLFERGNDPEFPEWFSYTAPTWDNYIRYPGGLDNPKIQRRKKNTPKHIFDQEYGAQFITVGINPLAGISGLAVDVPCKCNGGDLAAGDRTDYTVLIRACAECGCYREIYRVQKLGWAEQKRKIKDLYEKWGQIPITVDETGIGGPIADDLEAAGVRLDRITFTNQKKIEVIDSHIVAIDNRRFFVPRILESADVLFKEHADFQYKLTAAKNVQYGAPAGKHDDTVTAAALISWQLKEGGNAAWIYV